MRLKCLCPVPITAIEIFALRMSLRDTRVSLLCACCGWCQVMTPHRQRWKKCEGLFPLKYQHNFLYLCLQRRYRNRKILQLDVTEHVISKLVIKEEDTNMTLLVTITLPFHHPILYYFVSLLGECESDCKGKVSRSLIN